MIKKNFREENTEATYNKSKNSIVNAVNKFKNSTVITTNEFRSENAVTLTALVVTIIVMIILAAVSVLGVFGENGIFKSAVTAKEDTEVAAYEEELKAIEVQTRTQQMKASSDFVYLKAFENNVKNHTMFAEAREVKLKNNDTLRIVTEEGYIFYIADDEIEGVVSGGIDGETEEPGDLYPIKPSDPSNPGNNPTVPDGATTVTFGYSTKELTKEDVKVTVSVSPDPSMAIQYRINSGAWRKIDNNAQVNMEQCGTLYIRLYNGYTGGAATSTTVDWIDKTAPRTPTVQYSSTQDSITVTAYSVDVSKTNTSASSGNVTYSYKITGDGVNKTGWTEYTTNGTFTFDSSYGLVENGTYTIYVKARDGVGNETKEITISASTTRIPDGKGNITITADSGTSEASWTKGPVNVTIKNAGAINGYTLVYSLDGTTYSAVPSTGKIPEITTNETKVYAAFENNGKAHGTPEILEINYIDTEAPEVTAKITKVTSSQITVESETKDEKTNNGISGTSGIKVYYYSIDGLTWTEATSNSTYTFDNLVQNKEYQIKVKVEDKAGNEAETTAVYTKPGGTTTTTVSTEKIPDLNDVNSGVTVNFSKNSNEAYVKSIKVAATITGNTDGYIIQSSVDGGENWESYTSGAEKEFTKNGALWIRLYDGTNAGQPAKETVSNIDNLAPEVILASKNIEEKSFKVDVTIDDKETSEYASSGIKGFYWSYKKSTDANFSEEAYVETTVGNNTITIDGVKPGTNYTVKVYAIDSLDNRGEEKTLEVKTAGTAIPSLNPGEQGGEGIEPVQANMKFIYNPDPKDGITARPVNVKVELSNEVQVEATASGLELYYITDTDTEWKKLPSSGIDFSQNGTISVRLQENKTSVGASASASIDHIDTLAPSDKVTYKVPSYSADSIIVQAFGRDGQDGKSAVSGIRGIRFQYAVETSEGEANDSLSWSAWSEEKIATDTGSALYTITGLSAGTKYRIRVKLIDRVGKETISGDTRTVTTVGTGSSEAGSGDTNVPENIDDKIVYLYNGKTEETWTNDKVNVRLQFKSINTSDYTVRYRTDGVINLESNEGWTEYDYTSNGFDVSNNCLIAAQLISKDSGDMGDIYWGKVYCIDKAAPENFSITATPEIASVTVIGKSAKDNGTDGYEGCGIGNYEVAYFIPEEGQVVTQELVESMWTSDKLKSKQTITTLNDSGYAEYKFTNLNPGIECVFMMRALDKVGNPSTTGYTKISANNIPEITANDFTAKYYKADGVTELAADEWTNEKVILKLEAANETTQELLNTNCKFAYLVNYENSFIEYEEGGVEITKGTDVYIGLKYGNINPSDGVKIESVRIDTAAPEAYTILDTDVRRSSTSLTLTMPVEDLVDIGSNSFDSTFMSGINPTKFKYELYRNAQPVKSSGEEPIVSNTYKFEGLNKGTQYYFKVTYYDNAGNNVTITSGTVSTLSAVVTTKESVSVDVMPQSKGGESPSSTFGNEGATVTMTITDSKYSDCHIKYSFVDDKNYKAWNEYTEPFWIDENKTIYVQLQDDDGEGLGSISTTVACIDNEKPYIDSDGVISGRVLQGKQKKITVKIEDNGISGVYGYCVTDVNYGTELTDYTSLGKSNWVNCKSGNVEILIPESYTSTLGLKTLYLWIVDNAGNMSAENKSAQAQLINLTVIEKSDGSWDDSKEVNSPQLFEGLIPVVYDDSGNTVELEDLDDWYDYDKGKWANAVTVNEDNGKVTGYWVWIPRFAYKFESGRYTNNPGAISVEFLKDKTDNNSAGNQISRTLVTETGKEDITGGTQAQFVVHPSFTASGPENNRTFYNGEWDHELYGYWVAKFQAGNQNETYRVDSSNRPTDSMGVTKTVTLGGKKYNVGGNSTVVSTGLKAWYRGEEINDLGINGYYGYPVFLPLTCPYVSHIGDRYLLSMVISSDLSGSNIMYGLNKDETNSHMVKNSEWGAITYLSRSKYGLNYSISNPAHIAINNLDWRITGLASAIGANAGSTGDPYEVSAWYTPIGWKGSSTHTIYGVFDMAGPHREYVSGYLATNCSYLYDFEGRPDFIINKTVNGVTKNIYEKFVKTDMTIQSASSKGQESNFGRFSTRYATVYNGGEWDIDAETGWNNYSKLKSSTYGFGDAILEVSASGYNEGGEYMTNIQYTAADEPYFRRGSEWDTGPTYSEFRLSPSLGDWSDSSYYGLYTSYRVILCEE